MMIADVATVPDVADNASGSADDLSPGTVLDIPRASGRDLWLFEVSGNSTAWSHESAYV